MKRIFPHCVAALAVGLALRLYFVFKHPGPSGDAVLYEQIAANWLQLHIYGMNVNDAVVAVDLRMPGYPAFLALIYAITRKIGEDARLYVMLAQTAVDLCTCLLAAALAGLLAKLATADEKIVRRVFVATLWLATLCPFTANYVATPLTEVPAVFFTTAALLALAALLGVIHNDGAGFSSQEGSKLRSEVGFALLSGLLIGMGTLFRPETPLLLVVAWAIFALMAMQRRRFLFLARLVALSALGCLLPLAPWAMRNAIILHEVQFLAPKNSNLPGELVPYGFMAWEKTWLFRFADCYLFSWKLNGEVINLEDLPARAFDSPQEKERVAALLEQYDDDVTLTAEEDVAFGELARERTARHPLRTYVWLPVARAFTIWFTPRIELLPFSGQILPVVQSWKEDPIDFSSTVGFFVLNVLYVACGLWGAWRLWRGGATGARMAVALLLGYFLVRTAFLTTLETPEPRYVLVCYPALLAMAAQVFAGSTRAADKTPSSQDAAHSPSGSG